MVVLGCWFLGQNFGCPFFEIKVFPNCDFEWPRSQAIWHKSEGCSSCIGFRAQDSILKPLPFISQGRSREKFNNFFSLAPLATKTKSIYFLLIFVYFYEVCVFAQIDCKRMPKGRQKDFGTWLGTWRLSSSIFGRGTGRSQEDV